MPGGRREPVRRRVPQPGRGGQRPGPGAGRPGRRLREVLPRSRRGALLPAGDPGTRLDLAHLGGGRAGARLLAGAHGPRGGQPQHATRAPPRAPGTLCRAVKFLPSQLAYILGEREVRRNLRALLSFVAVLAVSIIAFSVLFHGIMLYEGQRHSWITGVYWTLTVMSTLGFGDITFQSDVGRVFSIVVLVYGIVMLLIVAPFTFIPLLLRALARGAGTAAGAARAAGGDARPRGHLRPGRNRHRADRAPSGHRRSLRPARARSRGGRRAPRRRRPRGGGRTRRPGDLSSGARARWPAWCSRTWGTPRTPTSR